MQGIIFIELKFHEIKNWCEIKYLTCIPTGRFCRYDHGRKENIEEYGIHPPPEYDLKKVTFPVATYWGDNDWLAEPVCT